MEKILGAVFATFNSVYLWLCCAQECFKVSSDARLGHHQNGNDSNLDKDQKSWISRCVLYKYTWVCGVISVTHPQQQASFPSEFVWNFVLV